jgi:hypothetical protein
LARLDQTEILPKQAEHTRSHHVVCEPTWNDPESVRFPAEWQIPERYDEITVRALFERFVDTRDYSLVRDGQSYSLRPLASRP